MVRKTMASHRAPRVNFLTPEQVSYRDTIPGIKASAIWKKAETLRRRKEKTSEEGQLDAQELFGVFAEFGD